jgi:sortase A
MISVFAPPVDRTRTTRGSVILVTSWILMIGGILLLAYAGYVVTEASAYQTIEIRRFEYSKLPAQRRILAEGEVIGEIAVARLGLKAIVVQGDSPRILRRAVGHISETALPGEFGNVALAAHRDTFFHPLREIRPGDIVTLNIPGQQFRYEVDSTSVVSPSESGVLQHSSRRELTLITCFPFGYVGPAPNRFVVHAREIGSSHNPSW